MTECVMHLNQLAQLLLVQSIIVHHHFQTAYANGQRGLHLVRGITDELFLLLVQLLATLDCRLGDFVEPGKLSDICRVVQCRDFVAWTILLEPTEQFVKGAHAAANHREIEHDNRDDQCQV